MLATLHAVATTTTLRTVAGGVNVHQSTLQDRPADAEAVLGRPVRTPRGRLRLYLAPTLRHLAAAAEPTGRPYESPPSSGKSSMPYRRARADITVR
jgi:hypothetical protein